MSSYKVLEIAACSEKGAVYRVVGPGGPRILKELVSPPHITDSERNRRLAVLLQAVRGWQKLQSPLAIHVEDVLVVASTTYLVETPREGVTASVACTMRQREPDPATTFRWAQEMANLVEELQSQNNPLAFQWLQADRLMISGEELCVFNPGWSDLLWAGPVPAKASLMAGSSAPVPVSPTFGLQRYGRLVAFLTTGRADLEALKTSSSLSLLWILDRCMSQTPGCGYNDFSEVQAALKTLVIEKTESPGRALGGLPALAEFRVPAPRLAEPGDRYRTAALWVVSLLLVVAGCLYLQSRNQPPSPLPPAEHRGFDRLNDVPPSSPGKPGSHSPNGSGRKVGVPLPGSRPNRS